MKHAGRNKLSLGICLLALCLTGCTWSRTKPLPDAAFNRDVPKRDVRVLVVFEEAIPGKPLPETVWDNAGPFWDPDRSKKIGFDQNYRGAGEMLIIQSRMLIPFGRILSETVRAGGKKSFSACHVAYSPSEAQRISQQQSLDARITVTVRRFSVSETRVNHIDFAAQLHCEVTARPGNTASTFEVSRNVPDIVVAKVWNTHAQVVNELTKTAQAFAEDIAAEILQNSNL